MAGAGTTAWGTPAGGLAWDAQATSGPTPKSLQDVMSEELAEQLEHEEAEKIVKDFEFVEYRSESPVDLAPFVEKSDRHPQDTTDDQVIAQMLQQEFDKEFDKEVQKREEKFNGTSKVSLSFENYRITRPQHDEVEVLSSEEEDYWDEGQYIKDKEPVFRNGISGKGENMITKHDSTFTGRKNTTKVMENFPPDVMVGDVEGIDVKLSNKVYNNLRMHSAAEEKRSNKLHEKKEHSTAVMAMDDKTRIIVYKLVDGDVLGGVDGIISTGKEAVVLHAIGGSGEAAAKRGIRYMPAEVALKVYKTTLSDFKNRAIYMKGDPMWFKDEFKKRNPRRIMKLWASKEEFNLKRLEKHNIPCPRVIMLKGHVLIMSFIGCHGKAAPKLKDAPMKFVDYELAWAQVKRDMKQMYDHCGLVHADLSEYNLLWHNETLHFIDVGQAVDVMHPHAHEFLLRDCKNMTQFFTHAGVVDVGDEYQLFNYITGLNHKGTGKDFLLQLQEYEKNEEKLRGDNGKEFSFDYFFELSQKQGSEDSEDSSDDEEIEAKSKNKNSKKSPKSSRKHKKSR